MFPRWYVPGNRTVVVRDNRRRVTHLSVKLVLAMECRGGKPPRHSPHRLLVVAPTLVTSGERMADRASRSGPTAMRHGKTCDCAFGSTPCQLRVTSFASKSRLVDRHPLYVPASAAPNVFAPHYGLRLHAANNTTTDLRSPLPIGKRVSNSCIHLR